MNRHTMRNISRALEIIACNVHTCETVKSLMIDIRVYCPKRSIAREFGDFIAHPDAKDRGILHSNISEIFDGMVRFFRASKGLPVDGPAGFTIAPPFTDTKIIDELFSLFTTLKVLLPQDSRWPRLQEQRDSICLCLLSLIQGAEFKIRQHRIPGFIDLVPEKNACITVGGDPIGPNCVPHGFLWFTANVPSELLTGDKYVDVAVPIITTKLRASEWIVGDMPKQNSGRCIFEAHRVDQSIKLSPFETVPLEVDMAERAKA